MLVVITFILTILGSLNWLCIGFFQYDIVAGFFGTQSSIFSRLIYILVGISSVFLTYAVIRYKGRLTIKKNQNQDKVLMLKQEVPESVNSNNLIQTNNTENTNTNTQNQQNINNSTNNENGKNNTNQNNNNNYNNNYKL